MVGFNKGFVLPYCSPTKHPDNIVLLLIKIKSTMEISFEKMPQAIYQLLNKVDNLERLMIEKAISEKPKTDRIFDIGEAASYCRLSKPTLYALVSQRSIPFSKKGKRLYFSEGELIDWIKQGRKKTQTELAQEAETYIANNKKKRV